MASPPASACQGIVGFGADGAALQAAEEGEEKQHGEVPGPHTLPDAGEAWPVAAAATGPPAAALADKATYVGADHSAGGAGAATPLHWAAEAGSPGTAPQDQAADDCIAPQLSAAGSSSRHGSECCEQRSESGTGEAAATISGEGQRAAPEPVSSRYKDALSSSPVLQQLLADGQACHSPAEEPSLGVQQLNEGPPASLAGEGTGDHGWMGAAEAVPSDTRARADAAVDINPTGALPAPGAEAGVATVAPEAGCAEAGNTTAAALQPRPAEMEMVPEAHLPCSAGANAQQVGPLGNTCCLAPAASSAACQFVIGSSISSSSSCCCNSCCVSASTSSPLLPAGPWQAWRDCQGLCPGRWAGSGCPSAGCSPGCPQRGCRCSAAAATSTVHWHIRGGAGAAGAACAAAVAPAAGFQCRQPCRCGRRQAGWGVCYRSPSLAGWACRA